MGQLKLGQKVRIQHRSLASENSQLRSLAGAQQAQIGDLQGKNAEQQNQIADLQLRLAALEQKVNGK